MNRPKHTGIRRAKLDDSILSFSNIVSCLEPVPLVDLGMKPLRFPSGVIGSHRGNFAAEEFVEGKGGGVQETHRELGDFTQPVPEVVCYSG
jgi:hypothetical protein